MSRRTKSWSDPFAALQELRAFLAARCRAAAARPDSWLGRAVRRLRRLCRRGPVAADDARAERAVLELVPMDLRNPPSENIAATALPLAAAAAAAAATAYLVASWQAHEPVLAVAAERVGTEFDAAPRAVAAVTLEPDVPAGGAVARAEDRVPPLEGGRATNPEEAVAAGAIDGSGSTLLAAPEEPLAGDGLGGGDGVGGIVDSGGTSGGGPGGSSGPGDELNAGASGGSADDSVDGSGTGSGGTNGHSGGDGSNLFPAPGDGASGGPAPVAPTGGSGASSPGGSGNSSGGSAGAGGGAFDGPTGGLPGGPFGVSERPTGGGVLLSDTARHPVRFVANAGQWAEGIDFVARGAGYQVALARDSATVALPRAPDAAERERFGTGPVFDAVRLAWTGVADGPTGAGEGRLDSVSNFFVGDPDRWRANVPEYGAVRYADAWAGVDLVYRHADGKRIEYDLVVKPGAAAGAVGFTVRGADARVDGGGRLVLTTASGAELVQTAPVVYQTAADGARQPVTGAYRLRADGSVGFAVGAYDTARELVIDPVLSYTTTLGGSGTEIAYAVAADAAGNAFAAGWTTSADFPTTGGAYDLTRGGAEDAFVAKFGPTGAVVWATYLGGSIGNPPDGEAAYGVAVGADGSVFVSGQTPTTNFPVTAGAFRTGSGGIGFDAFLTKLSADGTALVFSSYLGGSGNDTGGRVAIDRATGEAVVVGSTGSINFPTRNPHQSTTGGGSDAFVVRFNAAGSDLVFGTYWGGSGADTGAGVTVDSTGAAVAVGWVGSSGFTGRFSPSGVLRDSGTTAAPVVGVAVDSSDRVYVTGSGLTARYHALSQPAVYTLASGGAGIAVDGHDRPVVVGTSGGLIAITRYKADGSGTDWSDVASGAGHAAAAAGGYSYAAGTAGSDAVVLKYGPPPAPTITGFADDTGSSNSDRLTYDTTPTIGGTALAGSTVSVYRRAAAGAAWSLLGTTTVAGGLWTYTLATMSGDGVYALAATATVSGDESLPSAPLTFTLDTTAPAVAVSAATQTYDRRPPIKVTASDLNGLSSPATVTLDVDLNGDTDFADANETAFATGLLVDGAYTFESYPTLLTAGVTARVRARVTDYAGNEGTSATKSVAVLVSSGTWAAVSVTPALRSGYGGMWGWTTAGDGLVSAGDVTARVDLDLDMSYAACGCQDPYLVYHSQEAAPAPVVQARVTSDNALGVPDQVTGTLTWDGAVAGTVAYDLSQLSRGADWIFSAAPGSSLGTGRHTYALDLFVDYPGTGSDVTRSVTGQTFLVDRSSGPYGAGWSFSNTDALVAIGASGSYPAGVLRLFGRGGWAFYEDLGGGQYAEPPGDGGALAAAGGAWTYTGWDGRVLQFDSSGRQTTWTSADGAETLTHTYDGGSGTGARVATVAGPDGGVATFAYSSGLLATVVAPGSRTTTFAMSSGDLVTATDPSGAAHTFTYSAHRLTGETRQGVSTAYTYADGLVQTVKVGTDPVGTVVAAARAGVGTAAVARAGGAGGSYTDPLGRTTRTWFNGFGQPVERAAPDGGTESFARDSNGYVIGYTDALARTTTYAVNARGQVTGVTRPDASLATVAYGGSNGAPSRYEDYRGGVWTYTSDSYGRRTGATDPLGRTTTYAYDAGLLKTVTDPLGNVVTYLYDAARRPTGALSGGAVTGTTGYDAAGRPTTFADALGNVTTTAYDGAGRVTAVTNPLGQTTTRTYATSGRLLSVTDPVGNVTSYAYDAAGRVEATVRAYGTALAQRTTTAYDAAGNAVAVVNALGYRSTSVYDALDRVVGTVDPLGNRTTTAYDAAGQVTATVDPLGRVTRYSYDLLGRRVAVTDALANVSTTVYDADSHVTASVDALGNRTTSVYDAAGQMTASVDPLGNRTSYGYDAAGRQVTVTDPLGNVTTTQYDARGRAEVTVDALGKRATTVYDAADRALAAVDPLGNRTTTVYDTAGRAVATVDALGNYSTRVYDAAGRTTAWIDPLGNRTTTVYDALDRAEAVVDALGNRSTSVYDAADRLVASVDPLGNRVTSVYDNAGRVVARVDALGNRATTVYDAAGNVVAAQDALGRFTTYSLDALGRVVATTDALGAVSSVGYDAAGRAVTSTDARGNVTTFVYDAAGRRTAVIDALGNRSTTVYDAAGNATANVDALGRRTTSVYDALNRVQATVDALGQRSTVVYDDAGNMTASIDALGRRTTWVYDKLNRAEATIDALGNVTTFVYDAAGNRTAVVDARGNRTTSVYDALNRVRATVDALGNRATTTYDAAGNVRTAVDPLNRTTTFGYDARNLRVATTDALGRVWTTAYDALGRAWREIDPNGNDTRTYFDAAGRTAEHADQLGNRRTTVFDAAGNPIASVDERLNRTTVTFDALNRAVDTLDPLGNRSTVVYDAVSNATASIDALGRRTTFVYDDLNRVSATVDALNTRTTSLYDAVGNVAVTVDALNRRTTAAFDALNRVLTVTDALGGVVTTAYDAVGNATARTDPLNRTTTFGYDALNRAVTTTDALGGVSTTAYDAAGNAVAFTDPLNHTTTSVYDELDRVVATVDALGNRATSVYDSAGRMTASVNQLGNRTTFTYDLRGLVQTAKDPLGNVTTSTYDAAGNRTAVTNARGYTTTVSYDALNRAVGTLDALGNRTTSVFDAVGNTVATVDALGYRNTAVYDELHRVVAAVNPLGNRTTSGYDAVGNRTALTDPLNQTTTFGYDALNRVVTETDARGYVTTSVFDAAGNRTALVDASANRTTFAYDALNRVVTETDPQNVGATFAYDAAGRRTSETDRLGRRRDFAYDDANRVLTEKWYAAGGSLSQTQTWTYDAAGRTLTAQDPDGTYTLAYDAANRVTSVQEPFAIVLTMSYDATGNRTSVRDSKGGYTTVTFDALNRQTSEQTAGSGITAMRFDHAYTARGQVASLTRYSNLAGTTVVGTTTHDYDAAGRETHLVQKNGSGTVLANYTYTYDAGDRLTSKIENGTTTTYGYDAADQLTADGAATFGYDATGNRTNAGYATGTGNRVTSDGLWTWTYDAQGNATKRSKGAASDTWVYTYDHRNQMVSAAYSATDGGTVTQRVTYAYDAYGNRIGRQYWDGTATTTERFGVDGWDRAKPRPAGTEHFDVWADLDGSNNLVLRRGYGFGFDEVVARQTSGGTVLWYWADTQQSVRLLSDNSASVVGTLAYSAFGQVTSSSGVSDRYRYTSREADTATGLQDNNDRVYDVYSGRWMTVDRKGFAARDANLYRYVGNQPTTKSDPSGLEFTLGYYDVIRPGSEGNGNRGFIWGINWKVTGTDAQNQGPKNGLVLQFVHFDTNLTLKKGNDTLDRDDNRLSYLEAWSVLNTNRLEDKGKGIKVGTIKDKFTFLDPITLIDINKNFAPAFQQQAQDAGIKVDLMKFKADDYFMAIRLPVDKEGKRINGARWLGKVSIEGFAFYINNSADPASGKLKKTLLPVFIGGAGLLGPSYSPGGSVIDLCNGNDTFKLSVSPFDPANGALFLPFLPIKWVGLDKNGNRIGFNERANDANEVWAKLKASYQNDISNGVYRRILATFSKDGVSVSIKDASIPVNNIEAFVKAFDSTGPSIAFDVNKSAITQFNSMKK